MEHVDASEENHGGGQHSGKSLVLTSGGDFTSGGDLATSTTTYPTTTTLC